MVPPRHVRIIRSVPKQNSLHLLFISSGQLSFCLLSVIHSKKRSMLLLLLWHSSTWSTLCNLERFGWTKEQLQTFCLFTLGEVFENVFGVCLWDCKYILQSESICYCASFLIIFHFLIFSHGRSVEYALRLWRWNSSGFCPPVYSRAASVSLWPECVGEISGARPRG